MEHFAHNHLIIKIHDNLTCLSRAKPSKHVDMHVIMYNRESEARLPTITCRRAPATKRSEIWNTNNKTSGIRSRSTAWRLMFWDTWGNHLLFLRPLIICNAYLDPTTLWRRWREITRWSMYTRPGDLSLVWGQWNHVEGYILFFFFFSSVMSNGGVIWGDVFEIIGNKLTVYQLAATGYTERSYYRSHFSNTPRGPYHLPLLPCASTLSGYAPSRAG